MKTRAIAGRLSGGGGGGGEDRGGCRSGSFCRRILPALTVEIVMMNSAKGCDSIGSLLFIAARISLIQFCNVFYCGMTMVPSVGLSTNTFSARDSMKMGWAFGIT